jgi:ankyrin repeat protein
VAVAALVLAACAAGGDDRPRTRPTADAQTSSPPASPASPPSSEPPATLSPRLSREEQASLDRRLIDAAWDNQVAEARRLIAQGADVDAKDGTEQNAYLIATSEGYDALLELTLRSGADVRALDRFDGTGVIRAAERGHWSIVGRLVQEALPVDHVNNLGWTALHEAIVLGDGTRDYVDTVRVLVAAGADVTIRARNDGTAPVDQARERGYDTIAALLGKTLRADSSGTARADPDRRLASAARQGDADAVALALRAGGDVTPAGRGRAPVEVAASRGHAAVVRLLVAMGARRP